MRHLSINLPNNFRARYWLIAFATFLLITGVIGTTARSLISKDASPIHIAVAAPLTGRQSTAGKEMVQSIQLYLDSVNQQGGVHGHPLKLLAFDDRGDPNTVLPLTRAIDDSPSLVVLGHLTSAISIAAAPIYQALQIPAITGTASADRITQANPYSFRTVFTDSVQGSMLALYAQQALKFNTASVIYSDRPLAKAIQIPQLPTGYRVKALHLSQVEAWVEMFNQTFIDHWNFHPLTVEQRQYWMSDPDYDADLDLVAFAPDGTFAAFCLGYISSQDNIRTGRKEGWIADLGTRRGFRQQGLGRAMLLTGLQQLKAKGVKTALLGVDAENPSGALRLYESVGFRQLFTSIAYCKALSG